MLGQKLPSLRPGLLFLKQRRHFHGIKQMAEISIFPISSSMWKLRIYVRYEKATSWRNEGVGMKEEGGGKDRGWRVTLESSSGPAPQNLKSITGASG